MTDIIQRLSNQILSRVTSGDVEDAAMSEIERNRADIDELLGALNEYIAAADNSINPPDGDDIAAMIIFAEADKAARAAIAKYTTPKP